MPRMSDGLSNIQIEIALNELRDAIKYAGSQAKLGKLCGVSQGSVYQWLKNYGAPADRAIIISRKLRRIKLARLRPDLFGGTNG